MLTPPLFTIFYLLSLLYFASAAVHRVAHDDPNVQYIPSVCDLDCTRVCRNEWWLSCLSDGTASHRTKGNNTSSNFTFRGSKITWYTRTSNDGGKAVVYIDAKDPVSVDTNSPVTNEANGIFSKSGLDPTVSHTISVVYDINAFNDNIERFVDVHYFEYEDGGDTPAAGQSTTQNNSGSTNSGSSSSTTSSGTSSSTATSTTSGNSTLHSTATNSAGTLAPVFASLSGNSANPSSSTQVGNSSGGNIASVGSADGSSSKSLSTAAIVGAALGGLAGGLIIFFLVFWLRKERAHKQAIASTEQKEDQEDNRSTSSINGNNTSSLRNLWNNNSTAKFVEAENRYTSPNARRRFHHSASPGVLGGANQNTRTGREGEGETSNDRNRDRHERQHSGTGSLDDMSEITSAYSPYSGHRSLGLSLYPPPTELESGSWRDYTPSESVLMTPPPRYIG